MIKSNNKFKFKFFKFKNRLASSTRVVVMHLKKHMILLISILALLWSPLQQVQVSALSLILPQARVQNPILVATGTGDRDRDRDREQIEDSILNFSFNNSQTSHVCRVSVVLRLYHTAGFLFCLFFLLLNLQK